MASWRPRHDWREAGGLRSHAVVAGAGEPVVIVPGLGCSHLTSRRLQRALAARHEVWAYDPPGHGLTRAPAAAYRTISSLTDHLAAWLVAAGLEGACVLGHSLGGEVAIDLCARYPGLAGRLVLCATTGIPENPSVLVQLLNLTADGPRERLGYLVLALASYLRVGSLRMWHLSEDQHRHRTGTLLDRVRVPVLVVQGGRDPVVRPRTLETFRERLPLARALELADAAHALQDSHAPEVARAVRGFMASTAGTA